MFLRLFCCDRHLNSKQVGPYQFGASDWDRLRYPCWVNRSQPDIHNGFNGFLRLQVIWTFLGFDLFDSDIQIFRYQTAWHWSVGYLTRFQANPVWMSDQQSLPCCKVLAPMLTALIREDAPGWEHQGPRYERFSRVAGCPKQLPGWKSWKTGPFDRALLTSTWER